MDQSLKSILASGITGLSIAGAAFAQTEPPPPMEQAPPPEQAMEQSGDAAISEQVKAAFEADGSLQGAQIAIETVGGEVQLNGTVGEAAQVEKATAIAESVEGVKGVKNNLQPR